MLLNINANKLKQLRESKCWSQQQLADLSGLSLRTVQRIEAKAVASQESIKCLCAVFDIDIQGLLEDTALMEMGEETSASAEQLQEGQHETYSESKDTIRLRQQGKQVVKQLYIGFAVVFVSHLFGFYGIFSAFDMQKIDHETFQLLKNSLSIVLIISAVIFLLTYLRTQKKYQLGSSIF